MFWCSVSETKSDPTNGRSVVAGSWTCYTSHILMSHPIHTVTAYSLLWNWKVNFRTTDLHTVERFMTRNTNSWRKENNWRTKYQLDVTCYFPLLCAQHVSDINISIFRSLRLCSWITTSVLFSVRSVLELCCGWYVVVFVLQAETCKWHQVGVSFVNYCNDARSNKH